MSKASKLAEILAKIDTPEKAVGLIGPEREAYLKALTETFGDQATRAKDMGFGEQVYYHGSPADDIQAFKKGDPRQVGEFGIFAAEDPKFAKKFIGGKLVDDSGTTEGAGSIYPLQIRTEKSLDTTKRFKGREELLDDLVSGRGSLVPEAQARIQEHLKKEMKSKTNNWGPIEQFDISKKIKDKGYDSVSVTEKGSKNIAVKDPNQIRSTNAAYDPRFKDSDLIMAAKEAPSKGVVSTVLDKLGAPQRYAFGKAREALGLGEDTQDSGSFDIVQALADRAGLPEDSSLVNAGKAVASAGLDVFADPLSLIPVGKAANLAGKGSRRLAEALAKVPK